MSTVTPKTNFVDLLIDVLDYLLSPDDEEISGEIQTDMLVDRVRVALNELEEL